MKINTSLTDNSSVPEPLKKRCNDIQKLAMEGRCSLINLMDRTEKDNQERPQIFKRDADGRLWTGNLVGLFEYRTEDGTETTVIIGDRFGPEKAADDGADEGFLSPFSWNMLVSCLDETPLRLLNEYRTGGKTDIFDQGALLYADPGLHPRGCDLPGRKRKFFPCLQENRKSISGSQP